MRTHLKQIRTRRALSAADLASRAGVRRQTIYAIEDGTFVPNTAISLRLSRALDVTVEEMFSIAEERRSAPIRAELLGAERVRKGRLARLCRVNERLVAVPSSLLPAYLPTADAVIESRSGRSVSVNAASGWPQAGTRLLIAGCDPALSMLNDALMGAGMEIVTVSCSSRRALGWLKQRMVHAAGSHLVDRATGDYNLPVVRRLFPKARVRLITFAAWEQGLVVRRGNPKGIRSIADLAGRKVRIINREKGSGSRDLLDSGLRGFGIPRRQVAGYDSIAAGHLAAAYAVAGGTAECCIAPRSAARCFGLDFVPLAVERFDLSFSRAALELPAGKALADLLNSSQLRRKLHSIAGYDSAHTGEVLI